MRRVRPRFQLTSDLPPEVVVRRVGEILRAPGCSVSGLACEGRIELHVHSRDEHFWSPQLIVDLIPSNGQTTLSGRFGPHPSVWTMYVAGYAACSFGILVGISFAYAQWVMDTSPWSLLSIPVCLFGALGLYLLAFVGQKASKKQMKQLRRFLKDSLSKAEGEANLSGPPRSNSD